jgi:DNA-binding MurR/RpiR family transcriptional regulator
MSQVADSGTAAAVEGSALARLRAAWPSLTGTKRRVAEWMLGSPGQVVSAEATTSWIARRTETSESAVVRLCQFLGYTGFPEFKLALSGQLGASAGMQAEDVLPADISPDDSLALIVQKLRAIHVACVNDTFELLRASELERAAAIIRSAGSVMILGVGNSIPVALSLQYRLLRLGIPATFSEDATLQAIAAAAPRAAATIIAVSHSGRTLSVLRAAELACAQGAKVVSIVSDSGSPLARLSDVVLQSVAPGAEVGREALASRLAQLAIVDAVYVTLALALGEEGVRTLADTARAYAE